MKEIDFGRQFVNAASFEEALTKLMGVSTDSFDDVVFGIINESGLHQTVMLKAILKKLIDSSFTDTEQTIFIGAVIASCIDVSVVKALFSEQNIEFLSDIDNYGFILDVGSEPKETIKELE